MGDKFNRAMPQVWVPNHGAVRDAKRAHQEVCGAQIPRCSSTEGLGFRVHISHVSIHFVYLKPFLELGLKLEENFS